jgi:hypothetical protein
LFKPLSEKPDFSEVPDGADEVLISAAISHSTLDSRVAYLTCGLGTVPGKPSVWEFFFQIDVIALDGHNEDFTTQERDIAAEFIPAEIRSEIMDLVLDGLRRLLAKINPDAIYFVTKGRGLPDKALSKFRLIRQELEINGFFVLDEGTIGLGQRYWLMCKNVN